MNAIIFAVLLAVSVPAHAASPLETYLTTRDGYVEKFTTLDERGRFDDRARRDMQRAVQDLEKKLRTVIGPVAVKGFRPAGRINFDTLVRSDVGFGALDALVYTSQFGSKENKSRTYVTTSALFDQWLKEHRDSWAVAKSEVPKDGNAALALETFYTLAISADAAVSKYAELPIVKPAKAKFAFAMLAARSQDDAPSKPDEIIVAVLHEDRVFLASTPATGKIDPIPTCQEIWDQAEEQAESAHETYRESNMWDEDALELSVRLRTEGAAAFHRCYAEQAKARPSFAALVKQAQGLLERLPLN